MALVCRPTPVVRFNHMSEQQLKATHVLVGTACIENTVAFFAMALRHGTWQNAIQL